MPDSKKPCADAVRPIKEAVCIDTNRVYDSCADKDCLADLRVYFTANGQDIIDNATSVRCRGCEVLNVFTETEKVPFNRGYYTVDLTFFFLVSLDAFTAPTAAPCTVNGLCVFSKKCILYGSEGKVKIFSSEYAQDGDDQQLPMRTTNPRAKIQVADPICLDVRICRPCDCCDNIADCTNGIPGCIRRCFDGPFNYPSQEKAVKVTLGLFTIVQLERDVQILIPAYDFCIPNKECACETEDPCDSFRKIRFPVDEFFPPNRQSIHCDNCDDPIVPSGGRCSCAGG